MATAGQRRGKRAKHVSAATSQHAIIERLLEVMYSMCP
jgi:hypothetical protein